MRACDGDGDDHDDGIVTEAVTGASMTRMWMENSWQPRIVLSVRAVPAAAVGALVNLTVHMTEANCIATLTCAGSGCVAVNGSYNGMLACEQPKQYLHWHRISSDGIC